MTDFSEVQKYVLVKRKVPTDETFLFDLDLSRYNREIDRIELDEKTYDLIRFAIQKIVSNFQHEQHKKKLVERRKRIERMKKFIKS